jgi:prolipoprotein diacylglyceryltransferase
MSFPVEFHIPLFGRTATIPAHGVFEVLAYCVGFQTFLLLRRRAARRHGEHAALPADVVVWVIVGAVFGALAGSKLLAWLESARDYWAQRDNPAAWLGGKTIVGGLLGGWIGVELVKRHLRITRRTGDAFVIPLCLGIAIGRIGCFLTGLPDHTYGVATSLPWGVDFGDGIARHPTQLYESIFALLLGAMLLWWLKRGKEISPSSRTRGEGWGEGSLRNRASGASNERPLTLPSPRVQGEGMAFRIFMIAYLGFRFFVEFIKPSDKPLLGLSAIQVACAMGIVAAAATLSTWKSSAPHVILNAQQEESA